MGHFRSLPAGMTRRHFLSHLAAMSTLVPVVSQFTTALAANAPDLKRRHKAAILLWMGGGPSTIDLWDLKPGASTGGPFKPIATAGDVQICEHLPQVAKVMNQLTIIRSMSTREADHNRGRYYMHTGYVPNPDIIHPSYGSVVSHELEGQVSDLAIPPFVSIGGGSEGPGFLGMAYAPFVVDSNGEVRNARPAGGDNRLQERLAMLATIERDFIAQRRGVAAQDHAKILDKTVALMTSQQMSAFKLGSEPDEVRERYGKTGFGNGCLMARRLVEAGVSCVEVDLGGWDNHQNVFRTLEQNKLPEMDRAMSALVEDLDQRGLLADTAVLWMGEFGRTPRVNANVGRDHWARSWSVVVGGAGIPGGRAIGATNDDGTEVTTDSYSSQDLMASVLKALGISLDKTYTSNNGRPMKIANSGKVIAELFA
jgi:uncharacterized protein (DUF1501 family)